MLYLGAQAPKITTPGLIRSFTIFSNSIDTAVEPRLTKIEEEKMGPIEEIKRALKKAGLTESDVSEAIAGIRMIQEVKPIRDGEQYRAYEERYRKMMQDAGFVGGEHRTWEEYMDYVRTPAGMLALALFNRMAAWKKDKGVP